MRGNRTLVLVAIILLLLVVVAAFFWWRSQQAGGGETPEGTLTPTLPTYTQIVVAAQNIPKGMQIKPEDFAVVLQDWPNDSLPAEYLTSLEEVNGKYAAADIPIGMPVLPSMINVSGPALFPSGLVAYAIPLDAQGVVAWAPQQGDHVDVLAAIKLIPVDPEFQSQKIGFKVLPTGNEQEQGGGGGAEYPYGRFETLPNGQTAVVYPIPPINNLATEIPAFNLVVQMTVQDAIVWNIGYWQKETTEALPVATPVPDQTGGLGISVGGGVEAQATPIPTVQRYGDVELVTLLVKPQDALVLKYLMETGADLDLVLRPAGDTAPAITEPVWLRYILDKYQLPTAAPDLPVISTPLPERPFELTPLPTTPPPQG